MSSPYDEDEEEEEYLRPMEEQKMSINFTDTQKQRLLSSRNSRSLHNLLIDPVTDNDSPQKKELDEESKEILQQMELPSLMVNNAPRYATDIVRTKRFDSSALLIAQSQGIHEYLNVSCPFAHIDRNQYCTPFDRIATNYTPSCTGLTMKEGSRIALLQPMKPSTSKSEQVIGVNLTATAPDAFNASHKIIDIALSETGKVPPKRIRLPAEKALPALGSPQARREKNRLNRTKPNYGVIVPNDSPKLDLVDRLSSRFDSWDPEAIDEPEGTTEYKDADGGDLSKPDKKPVIYRMYDQASAKYNYDKAVKRSVNEGVVIATGSGLRVPVSEIKADNVKSIIMRVPTTPGFLDDDYMKQLLTSEIGIIKEQYKEANAQATVQYIVKNELAASDMHINIADLNDTSISHLWTNLYYQLPEWRVLRQTEVDRKRTTRAFQKMNRHLCSCLPIMLELQYLWNDGTLPSAWWDNMSNVVKCPYNRLLFVDVDQPKFRTKMPFLLDDFSQHVETFSKDVRDALVEYWVISAGGKLSNFINNIDEQTAAAGLMETQGDVVQQLQQVEEEVKGVEEDSTTVGNDNFNKFKERNTEKAQQSRIALEQSNRGKKSDASKSVGSVSASVGPSKESKNLAEGVVDAAVTLMSRQLRGMCENSLYAFANLFKNLSLPYTAQYSIFTINVRLRRARSKEITTEFNEPVEVCLQPDLDDIKSVIINRVHTIVNTSRGYTRPEQNFGQSFGGRNHAMVNKMMVYARHKKMNESAVSLQDEVVAMVKKEIVDMITKYYDAPNQLLNNFDILEKLLNCEKAMTVEKMISECVGFNDTTDSLQQLSKISTELESMIEAIKIIVPDVSQFAMFEVRCLELKELLIRQLRHLLGLVMDAVVEENRTHMLAISTKYNEMANTLAADIADSGELKTLQDFVQKSAGVLSDLNEQYVNVCFERMKFLFTYKHKLARDDIQILYTTFNWPLNIQSHLRRSYENLSTRKKELEELLEEDQRRMENEVIDLNKRVELVADNGNPMEFRKNFDRINAIKRDLELKTQKAEEVNERETLLELPQSDFSTRLEELRVNLDPLERLWITIKTYVEKSHGYSEGSLKDIDPEEAERTADELNRALIKLGKEFEKLGEKREISKRVASSIQAEVKEFINTNVPLMLLVCNPGMQQRHWDEIAAATGVKLPKGSDNYTINVLMEAGLQNHVKGIEDICVSASKEFGLSIAMDKMEKEWEPMIFDTKEYRTSGTRILSSIDEIQMMLDDQIVKTQAMKGSRFIKPFLERITTWEQTLISMQDILDNWLKVQSTWLYLEPIFSSDDIMRQMPTEGKMFRAVDNTWRTSMAKTVADPGCVVVARREGFLDSLIEANAKLEQIQKGLNDYLETKRLAFPRFFFLSNDELLEILAETKDPLRVQPHLKKCFDGIAELEFQQNLDITACADPKGERLDFPYEKVNHKMINPNDSGGNVEKWLIEVEIMMKKSLAYAIDFSMKDYYNSERQEWLKRWQGQVIICINQTAWCGETEKTITDGVAGKGLDGFYAQLCEQLFETVEIVRGDIPKALRVAIGALVVMDVHNRDTIKELAEMKLSATTDFDWLSQLRYYWKDDNYSAQNGKPGSVECKMINAMALYAYEYIGNQDRLVITPLTDRCYRTLMGAIHLNLGGAPEGPAGTGKTETTKDLAKAIAIQCVVTNCSDGLDYLAMAKFFKGLASSGSWACFDEFNRIQLEVLSVVAQQIMQIQLAKAKNMERFVFEGTELELRPTCCPFITMNPGYAGRAELPDNLKVLFRTVAMMVPDYAMISEIILYSFGYTSAKPLSVKIVTTYKLCSEQLSSQSHYDYGMRAVIAVLRAAGNLKRADGHLPEDVLVLRSIIDVNLPKFLSPDVPLFKGITSDLFPGVNIDPPDRDAMFAAFKTICDRFKLIAEDYFWDKVVQIYDMMVVRHGFMIVGMPFSGKTSAWKVLGEVLGLLSEQYPEDKRWSKVIPILQNPKSITMGQLYGQFDPVSHEWTDGVLAINYRNAASNKIGIPTDRKWILFDGPVDAIWIENMNTVLDDNKKLCLMSGEIIAMTDVMSMMFEPMDLLVASPATVSRCGMVYMEPEKLGWMPLYTAWLEINKDGGKFAPVSSDPAVDVVRPFILYEEDVVHITELVIWLVEPSLCFIRKDGIEMSPTVDANLVMSMLNIFEALLASALKKYKNPETGEWEQVTDPKKLKQRYQDLECCFLFAIMWSIGKSTTQDSQTKYSVFLESYINNVSVIQDSFPGVWNLLLMRGWNKPDLGSNASMKGVFIAPMPIKSDFYECLYITEESKWRTWGDLLGKFEIPPGTAYSSIVIPNNYTSQFSFLIQLLVPLRKHVLMCGPTGTGKSVYIYNTISKELPQDQYKPLILGFSAKTSANMTQDIIDGKLDKRRKGVYGPPPGQQSIIFVDDLNMPEVETYGAQPPIELIRQLVDNGGWYDQKEKTWRSIVDTSLIAAMGPAGGGRNGVTPRMLRHFNLFAFAEFDDSSLKRIFSTIVNWHFRGLGFGADIISSAETIVDATLETYRSAMVSLLPTPLKSHYMFNLRDFSRIIQGVLLAKPSESFNKPALIRLWSHEALRVFGDRLTDDNDRQWFHSHLQHICATKFGANFNDVFKHCIREEDPPRKDKEVTMNDMRNLLLGNYMAQGGAYKEITDFVELSTKIEDYLSEYNQQSKSPMDLVMFAFAIEHVSRIVRVLSMPGGNALLAGVGGSGRQSETKLAAFIAENTVFQIEISKNYTKVEWREDLKEVLKSAGTGTAGLVFLFSDTQIKQEGFVEDINNMLNSGEVPNIFPQDERVALCELVRPFAKQLYGKAAGDMNMNDLYAYFISRVRQNLHIVLAFSPIGDAFRDRLRKFPALINCCTIDWFTAWPSDALVAVAQKFLSTVKFANDDVRASIVSACQAMHMNVITLSAEFFSTLKRKNYVTPTSYLELIVAFKKNLDACRVEVSTAKSRYEVGLEKLAFAAEQVNTMQKQLADLQPELVSSAAATEELMVQIEEKMPGVMETRKVVSAEAATAQAEADIVTAQKNDVEADLAVAIPALEEAIEALNTIKPNDINEIKVLQKPPDKIKMVCRAVCIMLAIKPVRVPDPDDPTKRIMDYWGPSQKMLSDAGFLPQLMNYDKDNMDKKIVAEIKKDFIENPDFNPEVIAKASKAAEGMCRWTFAMITYDRVAKVVAPKKAALAEAMASLDSTLSALALKKAQLQQVEDDLATLENQLASAKQKKKDLETEADGCGTKILRANQLLDGLGGERSRWTDFAETLGRKYKMLTGDVLVSSGLLAYLGPFTAKYRQKQMADWLVMLKENDIPCIDSPSLRDTLGDSVKIRQWNIDGLPTDGFSVDNGIIVFNARRWPLMIDPQGQANKWIRNMEKSANLQVIKLTDGNYLRTLENAIQFGTPVLLENVGEELDPSLEPLLQKQLFKQGGVNCIRLGDSTVEYSDQFRFYITSKLRNPHYLPEVSVKVTLLNFMITPEGLQDQLLGIVVAQERPDLSEQRNQLIIDSANNKRQLKEIEDQILHIMSSSSGNILEDESAISTLKNSKVLSDEIKVKQEIAEETEKNIDAVRLSYSPIAFSSQILFFCIADLANIEPVYQYSLTWFINLFITSINKSEKGRDVEKRLENLDAHFTFSLYRNVCRSLLEKDKLLYSFLLTSRIMGGKGQVDGSMWFYLLTGGQVMDNNNPNPAPEWLLQKNWDAICQLAELPKFPTFKEDFISNLEKWKYIYDSLAPEAEEFPGIFAEEAGLGRLCAIRAIRSDKLVNAIQKFVADIMGEKFVKPPPFDLQACYADSTCIVPLVFILSPGSDPMGAVFRAGEQLKTQVDPISLGQGQGPKAEKLIIRAKEKGTWVVLQNCHLAPSFMNTLEKICEELDPDEVHPGFRLWCTTYPSEVFPVSVLQNGVKMTNEPPKGIRANLLGSFTADPIADDEFYGSISHHMYEFRRLMFGLCFFHAVIQERKLYGPLGWNIPYEFNESDLRICMQQLKLFLEENDFVPYKAILYTAGECNYGGRVTDDKDRRTLLCILNRFYVPAFLDDGHKISPSGIFSCPEDGTRDAYIDFIDQLPLVATPEVFGLHDNATLTKDQNDTNALLISVLATEGGGSVGGGTVTKEEMILTIADAIGRKLPSNYDMEFAQLKYPVRWDESMNTVLCQELMRFNNLLSVMKSSLKNVQKAVKGLVVMSADLEALGSFLFVNKVPLMWKNKSYPSLKPLGGYITDQQQRLEFFRSWLEEKPPPVFWLSSFFFTQAFLTGSAQNYARRYTIPIDNVVFDFEMKGVEPLTVGPDNGVYTQGLYLEGSRWDLDKMVLTESLPKVLFSLAPTMHWVPYKSEDVPQYPHYKCPVYKTSDRRGILATTGHSSNFVCFINMPSDMDENHWVERGVAMLTLLDD